MTARTYSLGFRLPLVMSAFVALVMAAFMWVAFRQVESALLQAGHDRAQAAADQLANLLALQARQRLAEVDRTARNAALRGYLARPDAAGEEAARQALGSLVTAAQTTVEVWDDRGRRVLTATTPATVNRPAQPPVQVDNPPVAPGVSALQTSNGVVFSDVVAEVTGDRASRVGFVVSRRALSSAAASDVIGRLVGRGAMIKIGNQSGGVWTDFSRIVSSPSVDASRRVGAQTPIAGTPWAASVEFPRDEIVAPAGVFLTRMILFGIGFVVAAAVGARAIAARITRLESRVEQRTTELDRFFGLSLDMLCIAGTDGYFKRLNPAWTAVLGWSDEELRSRPYLGFVHPDDRDETIQRAAGLASGAQVIAFENRYLCRDGSYRWLQWKAIPAGDGAAVYASARDVTEQRAKELQIRTLNDQLAQRVADLDALTSELEAFSYSVSHDLRAPLRHVTGFATLLQKTAADRLGETETRYVRTIVDSAARMGRLIDDLLAFSRMGRAPLARRRIQLDALVREAQSELQGSATETPVEWAIHPLPEVEGDPAMLRLVLVNLLSNAVKYSAGRDRAMVEVGEDGSSSDETVIYVRDNGVGFDMQYAHKLFGVFQRLHSSDEFEGTGIGLANVRRIVQRHGGRVWAESTVNRGATFFVALPKQGDRDL